jgi:hypothetical protein
MQIVRETSRCGPCIPLGQFVRATDKFIVLREWMGGNSYAEAETRISKWKAHTEPCRCCRDHADSLYPNGYMD